MSGLAPWLLLLALAVALYVACLLPEGINRWRK